jgi:hypothetical protein
VTEEKLWIGMFKNQVVNEELVKKEKEGKNKSSGSGGGRAGVAGVEFVLCGVSKRAGNVRKCQ